MSADPNLKQNRLSGKHDKVDDVPKTPVQRCRRNIFALLSDPTYVPGGAGWAIFINLVVALSIVSLVVETEPHFQYRPPEFWSVPMFMVINYFCNIIFTLDYGVRLLCAPNLREFVFEPLNIVDLLAIVPFYMGLAASAGGDAAEGNGNVMMEIMPLIRVLRLVRLLRLIKLMKNSEGIDLIVETVSKSSIALIMMVFMVLLVMVLGGCMLFQFEKGTWDSEQRLYIKDVALSDSWSGGDVSPFASIPQTFWCVKRL